MIFGVSECYMTPKIMIATHATPEFAMITVSDNGPGISPENLEKIREPLFTTKSFGTGLGLPIAQALAQLHGGDLVISSVKGAGTTIKILIPIKVL